MSYDRFIDASTALERHLHRHHPDILNALRGLLSVVIPEKAKALVS